MPKKRPQPSTPPDLPTPPTGAEKRAYYTAGAAVWYCREGKTEWREGTIDSSTSSTILQTVKDDETGDLWEVPVERIRLRF
ncbi:hypothetical protein DTO006G1_9641 [Penicillium roqueforti]|uniref:uncharacterized protein n=1 Tax=Penicillium rubens TaxID=1108849 RepID=UPI002A132151|nr:uncharacterized protein N7525_006457 [Penicillium rubens]KAI1829415.1 hypothetical protein CBS147337_9769 [Penicillium roqueforti]KAI2707811.1 hypothetical protein CBS147354_9435 [Penicillium roqueforti]KAI2751595.1 hypothetical protein DTO006G1_9641 [Penicillium roqueforti]KAI3096845.1 hypothetical protein CBS147333_9465 [Penicillium roqueforti]KAI3123564.1 hypothetical protein CBS147326_8602 [Penicillium roqueforti]